MQMDLERSDAPRIAIYSQDGLGLGHMRRTSSIARKLLQVRPDAGILTLSDSRLGQFFPTPQNHDYLKLPSIVKKGPGDWHAASLPIEFSQVFEMRSELIRSALLSFAPHIFLVDHMPHGAMGELLPALEALRAANLPTKIVLGLRDILDAPEVVRRRWQDEGAYRAIERYYDRVLVYGMRDVFDLAEQYQFTPEIVDLVRYTGYVCSLEAACCGARTRTRLLAGCSAGTKLIVAMAGGGADAYPLMDALLEAFPRVQAQQRCVMALVTGPFIPSDEMARLQKRARHAPVRILESVDDTLSYLAAADLVVAMAGYNTTTEILRLKKPAILIPRAGPSAEQRTRARLFAARRWIDEIEPEAVTPPVLAEGILSRLRLSPEWRAQSRPNLLGLIVAVYHLLALLPVTEPAIEFVERTAEIIQ